MKPYIMLGVASVVLAVFSVCQATIKVNTISQGWDNKQADVYFLLDSSSTMWSGDLQVVKSFVADMVKGMDIGPNKTRVGLGLFSTSYEPHLSIANSLSKEDLVEAIRRVPYAPGGSFLSRGIQGIRRTGLAAGIARQGVPHIGVIFTDGKSSYRQLTFDNATLAKKEGAYLFTVGMGRSIDRMELRSIASDPKEDFAFTVERIMSDSLGGIKRDLMKSMSNVEILQSDEGTCGKRELSDVLFVFNEYVIGKDMAMGIKKFIKALIKQFSMDSGKVRAGIVSDSEKNYNGETCPERDTTLGKYLTQEKFLAYLDSQNYPSTSTLLKRARFGHIGMLDEFGGRSDSRKRIVLFVHGSETATFRLRDEARRAKFRKQIEMFVVMIGVKSKKAFMDMASRPSYVTDVDKVSELEDMPEAFLESFCEELN